MAAGAVAGAAEAGDRGQQAKKGALDGLMIRQDFERQDRVALPPGLPASMTALAPDDPQVKVVEVALARRMEMTQPAAGRRALMMRWVTTRRGEKLDAMVAAALRAGGWVVGEGPVTSPISAPSRGTVSWTVSAPAQRAAWVRFEVVDADPAGALALPVEWLLDPPAWAAAVKGEAPVGFEFRHYHARRPGTVYSDLENLVGAFRPAAVPAFVDGLYGALRAAGFEADDDDPRLMRGPGPSSFTARTLPDGAVVIHHQRRWARPEAGAAGDAGKAGAAGTEVDAGSMEKAGAAGKEGEPAAGGARSDR
ncbi:MAG: hypothetical protein H6705_08390 [Myxococcales bacterium]|nr:hypothetical protein [Myxococcales bacterium]